jgi:hypothetical protein
VEDTLRLRVLALAMGTSEDEDRPGGVPAVWARAIGSRWPAAGGFHRIALELSADRTVDGKTSATHGSGIRNARLCCTRRKFTH